MALIGSRQLAAWGAAALLGSAVLVALRTQGRSAPVGHRPIRTAGPDEMRNPPRRWDMVDEQADQSFPASDPPGNY